MHFPLRPLRRGLASCGSSGSPVSTAGGLTSADTGATITFWTRNSDQTLVKRLADAYNATHKNQVQLNVIPNADFITKLGAATASDVVPDVAALDLVYTPAFAAAGQLTDITTPAKALPFFSKLSPSHIRLDTYKGALYGLPFSAEGSFWLYNKDLFKQAGLDPEKPPTTWAEFEADSKAITALGNNVHGFYFPGGSAGSIAFTVLPLIWANSGDALNADGTQATMNTQAVKDAFNFYQRLWQEGQIAQSAKADSGSSQFTLFEAGKVGIIATGAFELTALKTKNSPINYGATPIVGTTGGSSSFAGGDNIVIPKGSKHAREALNFIEWTLADAQQIEIIAKNNGLPVRTDLAANIYSNQDPRYVVVANAFAKGRTPYSVKAFSLFNDPQGPWLAAAQHAIFDGQTDDAVNTAQQKFTQILTSGN